MVATLAMHPLCHISRRVSFEGSLLGSGITFLITREYQCLMSQDVESYEDCLRLLQVNPNVLTHILTPEGPPMITRPSVSHC